MNQRRAARFETDQEIWITVFGDPDVHLPARIRNVSARGIGLALHRPVASGAAIKIQLEDALLLGEVIYCRTYGKEEVAYSEYECASRKEEVLDNVFDNNAEGSFYVGVELEQCLAGLVELSRSLQPFADSPSGTQQAEPVEDRTYQN